MIISRTPFRVSFFGGGTDYHTWYEKYGGEVLSTTINHYCYITARHLPPFFPEKSRVVWSKIEQVMSNADIEHPSVRAVLDFYKIENGVEIHHTGDLPARSGLGSSSSFTVGMLNALAVLEGGCVDRDLRAQQAINIERYALKENVGIQDQIAASYGGFNHIAIDKFGEFDVRPVKLPFERLLELESHLLLFFTGISRTASDVASEQMKNTVSGSKDAQLHRMQEMVSEAMGILKYDVDICEFGRLLHESWMLKRGLASNISPQFVDDIYAKARRAGAIGGKLLGAGGGGFMLFFAKPDDHDKIRSVLKDLLWVPFKFENEGSKIIFSDPNSYSRESLVRRDYSHGV